MSRTRITRTDVAVLAQVSKTTVSFVLNDVARSRRIAEDTIQRVLDAIHTLDYAPRHHAQALAGGASTRCLGLCLPRHDQRRSPLLHVLMRHAQAQGWSAGCCAWAPDDSARWHDDLLAGRYDRLCCLGAWSLPANAPACLHIDNAHPDALHYDRAADCRRLLAACPMHDDILLIDDQQDPQLSAALRGAVDERQLRHCHPQAIATMIESRITNIIALGDRSVAAMARLPAQAQQRCIGIGLIRPGLLPPRAWGSTWPINACAHHLAHFLSDSEIPGERLMLGEMLTPE